MDTAYLLFGGGVYDILDDEKAFDLRVDYRSDKTVFWEIKPFLSGELTSQGSVWAGAGLYVDFKLHDQLYLTPSFGAGLYAKGGSNLDLGYPLEFRSQLDLSYEFEESKNRLGVAFGHISNASLDEDNPGTEILGLYYHIPIAPVF